MKLFVENLTNVDFSYLDPQRGLVGESWLVQLELDGGLNDQGMICDFGIVKKAVKQWFDDSIDHTLVVPTGMAGLTVVQQEGHTRVDWSYPSGGDFYCAGPEQSISLVDVEQITTDGMSVWCHEQLMTLFSGEDVRGLSVTFKPEVIEGDFYHYSHGLQLHDGNCQRIAHGHRSKIEIFLNGQRNTQLEQQWANNFDDIYIGTRANLTAATTDSMQHYAYTAPQGLFELGLPADKCYVMDTETTVELIAEHLATVIKQQHPNDEVTVRAFEGVGKGAISQK